MEFDRGGEEGIERGIREQVERGAEPAVRRPAWSVRGRNTADLTGDELEAAAVKAAAERELDLARPVPAELQDRGLIAGEPNCSRKTCFGAAGVDHEIAIAGGTVGRGKTDAQRAGKRSPRGRDVDQRNMCPWYAPAQPGDQRAND